MKPNDKAIEALANAQLMVAAQLSDGTMIWHPMMLEAADEITRLRAENKELLEALKPFVRRLEVLEETIMHRYAVRTDIDVIHLRAARAAIEGVTEPNNGG